MPDKTLKPARRPGDHLGLAAEGDEVRQLGQTVGLGERPQQDEVGPPAQQVQRGVGVADREGELDVGLVEDHAYVVGNLLEECLDLLER